MAKEKLIKSVKSLINDVKFKKLLAIINNQSLSSNELMQKIRQECDNKKFDELLQFLRQKLNFSTNSLSQREFNFLADNISKNHLTLKENVTIFNEKCTTLKNYISSYQSEIDRLKEQQKKFKEFGHDEVVVLIEKDKKSKEDLLNLCKSSLNELLFYYSDVIKEAKLDLSEVKKILEPSAEGALKKAKARKNSKNFSDQLSADNPLKDLIQDKIDDTNPFVALDQTQPSSFEEAVASTKKDLAKEEKSDAKESTETDKVQTKDSILRSLAAASELLKTKQESRISLNANELVKTLSAKKAVKEKTDAEKFVESVTNPEVLWLNAGPSATKQKTKKSSGKKASVKKAEEKKTEAKKAAAKKTVKKPATKTTEGKKTKAEKTPAKKTPTKTTQKNNIEVKNKLLNSLSGAGEFLRNKQESRISLNAKELVKTISTKKAEKVSAKEKIESEKYVESVTSPEVLWLNAGPSATKQKTKKSSGKKASVKKTEEKKTENKKNVKKSVTKKTEEKKAVKKPTVKKAENKKEVKKPANKRAQTSKKQNIPAKQEKPKQIKKVVKAKETIKKSKSFKYNNESFELLVEEISKTYNISSKEESEKIIKEMEEIYNSSPANKRVKDPVKSYKSLMNKAVKGLGFEKIAVQAEEEKEEVLPVPPVQKPDDQVEEQNKEELQTSETENDKTEETEPAKIEETDDENKDDNQEDNKEDNKDKVVEKSGVSSETMGWIGTILGVTGILMAMLSFLMPVLSFVGLVVAAVGSGTYLASQTGLSDFGGFKKVLKSADAKNKLNEKDAQNIKTKYKELLNEKDEQDKMAVHNLKDKKTDKKVNKLESSLSKMILKSNRDVVKKVIEGFESEEDKAKFIKENKYSLAKLAIKDNKAAAYLYDVAPIVKETREEIDDVKQNSQKYIQALNNIENLNEKEKEYKRLKNCGLSKRDLRFTDMTIKALKIDAESPIVENYVDTTPENIDEYTDSLSPKVSGKQKKQSKGKNTKQTDERSV